MAQIRQKSYANVRRKNLEFKTGEKIFLKVAPMRGVLRFGRKGKLIPRFIGPFEICPHVVDFEPLQLNENLSYEWKPVRILAREVKMLYSKEITLVKVLWQNNQFRRAIWEGEDEMRTQYSELFQE
ncbi:uncharacterized protein LOC120073434 [Benincasa hispida]|uniref:uncharacterized protein LOC120073434 n=1 Tax=Benincasa hispida TaxID=102211 RepID=UPI0019018778|nr:uncharacterized protein LOC120073434 [Benincasa hispida]